MIAGAGSGPRWPRTGLLLFPGAFTPLSAMLIEAKGFDGVYASGAVMSAELGLPDIGLTTLTEVTSRAREIARVTTLPVLVDADTGFGEVVNLAGRCSRWKMPGWPACTLRTRSARNDVATSTARRSSTNGRRYGASVLV